MPPTSRRWTAPVLAAAGALAIAALLDRVAPAPSADVARGSEEPFTAGLHLREIPPGGRPQRWTRARAVVRFRDVPAGPAVLEVALRGHRGEVTVAMDGVLLGRLAPGQPQASFDVRTLARGRHDVELRAEPFVAGDGRELGALLQSVRLRHAAPTVPSATLALTFLLPAAVMAGAALAAGLRTRGAALAGLALAFLQALLLWPQGLLRSAYAPVLAAVLAAGAVGAAAFAAFCERRRGGAGRWALVAVMAAFVVQGVFASSPVMVVSDAVFHANNLARVAGGDYFITSVTQHARPFRFPYGVSFYAVLVPLARAGVDAVALVRVGAAVSAVAASAALFLLLLFRATAARAGLAVVLLQLLPVTLDVHSHGNLSNVFGQAATTGFFAWWAGATPGGWPLGALLLAVGSVGHFGGLVVLAVLAAALVLIARRAAGRTRLVALLAGLLLAAAYYASFAPMVAEQVPRLLEGGGQGRGASRGAWSALRLQLLAPLTQWGLPALVLAWFGRPRRGSDPPLGRDLVAYWLAGAVLAVLAVVSPLEVRYLYALSVPLAVAAGSGAALLWGRGGPGRGAAALLLLAQGALAAANALDALLRRYR
jgi:hypothetical protein